MEGRGGTMSSVGRHSRRSLLQSRKAHVVPHEAFLVLALRALPQG